MIPHVHAADTSERNQSRGWRALLLVIILAAALRAAWMIVIPVVPVSDSVRYDVFAQRLAQGLGYTEDDGRRTAYWPVGPSFLFSLCYRITGWESEQRFLPVAIMNLLMGTASVALTAHLGRKWFSHRVGLLAGLLLALWPSQIEFTTVLASETPMIFFMLAGLVAWYADRWPWWLRGVLAGMFFAAASFMRPTALLVPVVVALADLVGGPRRLQTMGRLILVAAAMAACIAPWTYRNYRVFNAFVPISTNGGVNFWMGNNPRSQGGYMPWPSHWEFADEVDRDQWMRARAFDYITAEPTAFLSRTFVKAIRFHERETIAVHWNSGGVQRGLAQPGIELLKWLSTGYWWLMLALALASFVRLGTEGGWLRWLASPPVALWCYFVGVHAVVIAMQDRFHFAAVPAVGTLAATLVLCNKRLAAESGDSLG